MLHRKAENKIKDWLTSGSKSALVVTGARQVGKTWSVRNCLDQLGCNYIEINLIEEPEMAALLARCENVNDLIINISASRNYNFIKGETVIFIDEVQEFKDIVTRIKFWVDEGSFRYILSGSLLGIELRSLRSAPVGYVTEIRMFPLDFEEFLKASGVTEDTLTYLQECFNSLTPVQEMVHKKMLQHFTRYLVVGGMPAAVQEYVSSYDISRVSEIQGNIIEYYKYDFTKYEDQNRKLQITAIYDAVPSQLLKQNRRFNYNDLKKGLRFERIEDSFLWLTNAGVAIPVFNASEPRIALTQNTKSTLLKLYFSDTGLLTYQYGNSIRAKILTENKNVNLGGIYENAVAQELTAQGFRAYYYNSHKAGELDFIIEKDLSVIPIKVKSGKDYYVHSAISNVCSNEEYKIRTAYVLANCNISVTGKITYLPIYMATFIRDSAQPMRLMPLEQN